MRTFLALGVSLSLFGCAHSSDVELRNPLVAGALDQNRIVKPHDYVENQHGLPRGSVADEASLLSVDAQQICIGLTMHELDPIDFNEMDLALKTPEGSGLEQARVEATPVTFQSYDGLVAETHVTGEETSCVSRDSNGICQRWATRPTRSTTMVPGAVKVYEARGRLCFDNQKVVTPATKQVTLMVKMRRRLNAGAPAGGFGLWGMGGGSKAIAFRWGFPSKG